MKKWLKGIGWLCLLPIVLVTLLSLLLYIPAVQDFSVRKATEYASEAMGMRISIERIRLSFPLDLTVRNVEVVDTAAVDTVLSLRSLTVRIQARPLFRQKVLVDAVDLEGVTLNTGSMLEGMEIKGFLGKLHVKADHIDLAHETATFNTIDLSDTALTLIYADTTTTEEDTTSTSLPWAIALTEINLERVAFTLEMPNDTLNLAAIIREAQVEEGLVDLGKERYTFDSLKITDASLAYDGDHALPAEGLDAAHIHLSNLNTLVEGIAYQGMEINARIQRFTAEERSGLTVTALKGDIIGDGKSIEIPQLILQTPHSEVSLTATVPWSSLEENPQGNMNASLTASFGKEDVSIAAGSLPKDFMDQYPESPIQLEMGVEGNLAALRITKGELDWPETFHVDMTGHLEALMDSVNRAGEIELEAATGNLDFILAMLPEEQRQQFAIPAGIQLKGLATIADQAYLADFTLTEDKGKVELNAKYDPIATAYEVHLTVDSLEPTHFMPQDSLYWLAASLEVEGEGMDFYAPETWARLAGKVGDIRYGNTAVADVTLTGSLEKNRFNLNMHSEYPLAKMDMALNGELRKERIQAFLSADVKHVDPYGMHFLTNPMSTSFQFTAEVETDLNEKHSIDMSLSDWELLAGQKRIQPKDLRLHARTDADTIGVTFNAGDLDLTFNGGGGISTLTEKLTQISDEMLRQFERDTMINLNVLSPLLPDLSLSLASGQDNPIYNFLQLYDLSYGDLSMNISTTPEEGLRMNAVLYDLMMDTIKIDSIRAEIYQDAEGLTYTAHVIKNPYLHQPLFTAGLDGTLRQGGKASARAYLKNAEGETGLLMDLNAIKDNIEIAMTETDLGVLSQAIGMLPAMKGILTANIQYAPTADSSFMAKAQMDIDELFYENERVGKLSLNAAYLPQASNSHLIDAHFLRDDQEISTVNALYQTGETDLIEGTFNIIRFPLDMANAFIPDNMAKMSGEFNGTITVNGTTEKPQIAGTMGLDSAAVFVTDAGSSFRFDDKKVEIKDNKLIFNKFGIYAYNENPFLIDGEVDFNDLERMTADLRLSANNLQLLNVKKNRESLVYGKLFVNLNSTVQGPVDALDMRGDLQLLGGTNITYILRDSPLAVEDRMSDMVTFTSFAADTLPRPRVPRNNQPMGGMNMLMTIRIDEAVQANVDLDEDGTNHINLEGGGDLSFQYTAQGDMIMSGRYTLTGGTIKYTMPVIPLKEFIIQDGSYVQWTGNAMDPLLNLTATERVRTSVTPSGESSPRSISFDVGIALTERLENLGLQFTLEAPEDLTMQEELDSKGLEERSKLAVSMLVTGMYLGSDNEGKVNLNMGNALSSFLQNEINNIAGNALKSVDISLGMETYDEAGDAGTSTRTDYSFRFAKRFYNDRIRIVLGGRISTGDNINDGQAQPFIDNISVEYRLDSGGSRYVKLFHDKNYNLLEGEITETGGGIVLRKKMMRLRELFNFKKKKTQPVSEEEEI